MAATFGQDLMPAAVKMLSQYDGSNEQECRAGSFDPGQACPGVPEFTSYALYAWPIKLRSAIKHVSLFDPYQRDSRLIQAI
jgi:hypothetical protein